MPQSFETRPIPSSDLRAVNNIRFLHPGYESFPQNLLLSLPRVDQHATGTLGVHHRTALIGCQIIANNVFECSYLALDREGRRRVDVELDDILTERIYYLIVEGAPAKYAIVPSFQDWQFPHGCIPSSWPDVPFSPSKSRCGVTNFSIGIEDAHIVPQEETLWYEHNGMRVYTRDFGAINDPVNLVTLRADIHKYFDKRWLVVVPKMPGAGGTAQYVSHVLSVSAGEIWPKYHNVLVQYLDTESRPYLFARFAWAILLFAKSFITAGEPRQVVQLHVSTDADNVQRHWKAQFLSGEQLKSIYGGGGSKSATPRKRRSVPGSVADEDIESSETDDDTDNVWDNWESRNRRHQQISTETAPEEDVAFPKTGELVASIEGEDVVLGVGE